MSQTVLVASFGTPTDDVVALAGVIGEVVAVSLPPRSTSVALCEALVALTREVRADAVVLPAGRAAAELAGLLSHELGAALVVDAASVEVVGSEVHAAKRELGGTWDVVCAAAGPVVVLAQPAPAAGPIPAARQVELRPGAATAQHDVELLSCEPVATDGASVADAAVVVAAGRGLEGDVTPVRDLADALGGAVGATRDIVEEDWIGPEAMVGQTGVMIAPRLYIGAGLSGAPHHVLGMRAAETIVAINLDPDAPIMELADLAIVGDAASVLTEAAALVREGRGR